MTLYVPEVRIQRPREFGGEPWALKGLTEITVLFGKDGSGKSLLLRSWRNSNVEATHYIIPERPGDIDFRADYMTSQITPQNRRDSSPGNFRPDYRRQIVGRIQAYFIARGAHRGQTVPLGTEELEQLLGQLIPDFSVSLLGSDPPYKLVRLSDDKVITSVDQLSSGEAELFTVALDVLTIAAIWEIEGRQERILLIDEPDAHIHPDLQVRFADFLSQVLKRFHLQVVVATHSTTLLSALGQFGNSHTSVIYLDLVRDEFHAQLFDSILKELSACLGGHVLMGPLFGAPLLLVEGDDDYRIWSQVPRHHNINLAVIPTNGGEEIKKYQRTLEQIFASLREPDGVPVGYALLDGDKSLPSTTNRTAPQDYIRFVHLNCREAENLFLADEVLADIGTTWEEARKRIVAESENYGNKQELLARAPDWDRCNEDIKMVINEVSQILDPKNVHWTIRVGRCIGRNHPRGRGQIAHFLGEQVIDALWPQP